MEPTVRLTDLTRSLQPSADNYPQLPIILPGCMITVLSCLTLYGMAPTGKTVHQQEVIFMMAKTSGLFQLNYANTNTQGNTISV